MTTQEIANQYYQLASENNWVAILDTLHHDDVQCKEPEHVASRGIPVVTQGKAALKAKGAANREQIETIHSQYCSEPLVAGNFFTVTLKRDVTFKNRPRVSLEEIGLFQIQEGKIILEQFFY